MKRDSIVARRTAESISLQDVTRPIYTGNNPEGYSLGGDIDDQDRLSKGSSCCAGNVYETNGQLFCSKCAQECDEEFEDDDEYIDRVAVEAENEEELNGLIDDAYEAEEEGGY